MWIQPKTCLNFFGHLTTFELCKRLVSALVLLNRILQHIRRPKTLTSEIAKQVCQISDWSSERWSRYTCQRSIGLANNRYVADVLFCHNHLLGPYHRSTILLGSILICVGVQTLAGVTPPHSLSCHPGLRNLARNHLYMNAHNFGINCPTIYATSPYWECSKLPFIKTCLALAPNTTFPPPNSQEQLKKFLFHIFIFIFVLFQSHTCGLVAVLHLVKFSILAKYKFMFLWL